MTISLLLLPGPAHAGAVKTGSAEKTRLQRMISRDSAVKWAMIWFVIVDTSASFTTNILYYQSRARSANCRPTMLIIWLCKVHVTVFTTDNQRCAHDVSRRWPGVATTPQKYRGHSVPKNVCKRLKWTNLSATRM